MHLRLVKVDHCSLVCEHTSSIPQVLLTPNFFKENEVFYHLLVPFYGPPSSFGEQFLSHRCAFEQFDEFLLVDGSFFHLVGSEVRPRWGLRLALGGFWADQLRLGAHFR